jgi:hypothetical protein
VKWVTFPDQRLQVNGLPWFDVDSSNLARMPKRLKGIVRDQVWHLAQMPAGGRIRFRSDSTAYAIHASYPESAAHSNMSLIGQMGLDLYADNRHWLALSPRSISAENAGDFQGVFCEDLERRWREITIYLPNYNPVELLAIGVDEDAQFEPASPFAVFKPVVYYGSSITQGGCASRSGMSYQAIISRMHDTDFVNFGFSGAGIGEPEVAQAMSEIDASCYVLDYAVNVSDLADLRGGYSRFVETLLTAQPDVPIVAITPIYATNEVWSATARGRWAEMREIIRNEVAQFPSVRLVEGYSIFGPDVADGFADSVHPNDVGFSAMAKNFAPTIAEVIGLTGESIPL